MNKSRTTQHPGAAQRRAGRVGRVFDQKNFAETDVLIVVSTEKVGHEQDELFDLFSFEPASCQFADVFHAPVHGLEFSHHQGLRVSLLLKPLLC